MRSIELPNGCNTAVLPIVPAGNAAGLYSRIAVLRKWNCLMSWTDIEIVQAPSGQCLLRRCGQGSGYQPLRCRHLAPTGKYSQSTSSASNENPFICTIHSVGGEVKSYLSSDRPSAPGGSMQTVDADVLSSPVFFCSFPHKYNLARDWKPPLNSDLPTRAVKERSLGRRFHPVSNP